MKEKLLFGMKDYCRAMVIVVGITLLFSVPFLLLDYLLKF